jgi:hypothetical protein
MRLLPLRFTVRRDRWRHGLPVWVAPVYRGGAQRPENIHGGYVRVGSCAVGIAVSR